MWKGGRDATRRSHAKYVCGLLQPTGTRSTDSRRIETLSRAPLMVKAITRSRSSLTTPSLPSFRMRQSRWRGESPWSTISRSLGPISFQTSTLRQPSADVFYNGALVYRTFYILVDGAQCKLPLPDSREMPGGVSESYGRFVHLLNRVDGNNEFESYFERAGLARMPGRPWPKLGSLPEKEAPDVIVCATPQ